MLSVWILSDGKPGHFNQSRGVLKALEKIYPVQSHWVDVRLPFGASRTVLRLLLNRTRRALPLAFASIFYQVSRLPAGRPDVIISTGGKTSFLNAWLARHYQCPNVFVGSLRGLSDRVFSLVLTLQNLPQASRCITVDLPPTAIDPHEVQQAGDAYRAERGLRQQDLWTMVIGGGGAGYTFHEQDWRMLGQAMEALAKYNGIRWLVTTSRRTGEEAERLLRASLPRQVLADAVWYGAEPRSVMLAFLGAGSLVFCTEDSMSMITEAIASARPVFTVYPEHGVPEPRYLQALEKFMGNGWLLRVPIRSLHDFPVHEEREGLRPLDRSPSELLLEKIEATLRGHLRSSEHG